MSRMLVRAARAVDTVLDRSVVFGYPMTGHLVRRRLPTWPPDPGPESLRDKHVAVTGATSGLGVRTAADLAALGATVHLVVRDVVKGAVVADRIAADTGRSNAATVWECDLASTASVAAFVAAFESAGLSLSALVHNAGVLPASRQEDDRGHEITMAVHVLGPVAMTDGLLANFTADARVVFVTSGGMYTQRLTVDDLDYRHGRYRGAVAYARSKRAQVELLPVLADRWAGAGAAVYAAHPGWAASPGVASSLPGFDRIMRPLLRRGDAGVDTVTWLAAVDPRPPGGGLWHDRRERPTSYGSRTVATDGERAALWRWVAQECGIPLGRPSR